MQCTFPLALAFAVVILCWATISEWSLLTACCVMTLLVCVLAIMDDREMSGVERDTYNDGPLVPSGSTLCKACLVKGSRYPHCVPTLQYRQLSVPGSSTSTPSVQAAAPREAPTRTLTAPRRSQLWSYGDSIPTLQYRQLPVPGSRTSTPSAQAAAAHQIPTRTLTAPLRSQLWSDVRTSTSSAQAAAPHQIPTRTLTAPLRSQLWSDVSNVPTLQYRQLPVPGSRTSTSSAQDVARRQARTRTLTAPRRSQLWSDVSSGKGRVLAQFQRITNGLVRSTKNLLMIVVVERTD